MEKINFKVNSNSLFLLYFLISISYFFSKGFFSIQGGMLLLVVYVIFLSLYLKNYIQNNTLYQIGLKFNLIFFIILTFFLYGGLYQVDKNIILISLILIIFSIIIYFINLFCVIRGKTNWHLYLFMIAIILRILMVVSSPSPYIDVFDKLTTSSKMILRGVSPYSIVYKEMYKGIVPDAFVHFPGIFVFLTPAYYIFGDIRFAYIFFDILVVLLMLRMSDRKNAEFCKVISMLYLFNPISLFVLEQSWLEPLMLGLVFLTGYLYIKNSKLISLSLGLLMCTKIILFPIGLLAFLLNKVNKKYVLLSFLVILVFLLPFLIFDIQNFLYDIFYTFFDKSRNSAPLNLALTFWNLIKALLGIDLYKYSELKKILFVISIFMFVFPFFSLNFKKISLSYFYYLMAFSYFGFYFFSFQAFANYYFFISNLLLFSLYFKILGK